MKRERVIPTVSRKSTICMILVPARRLKKIKAAVDSPETTKKNGV